MSEVTEEEGGYSIKKTLQEVGHIYPVLLDAQGRVIDGHHRLGEDPDWPVYKLPNIKTDRQFLLAKLIANFHRRQLSKEEKTAMLDAIAKETDWEPEEIAEKMGVHPRTVRRYISDDYKNEERSIAAKKANASVAAKKAEKKAEEQRKFADNLSAKKKDAAKKADPSNQTEDQTEEDQEDLPIFKPTGPQPKKNGDDISFNPLDVDLKEKFVHGFNMWFVPPSHPVTNALFKYCKEKEVYWKTAVIQCLGKMLEKAGYLEKILAKPEEQTTSG